MDRSRNLAELRVAGVRSFGELKGLFKFLVARNRAPCREFGWEPQDDLGLPLLMLAAH